MKKVLILAALAVATSVSSFASACTAGSLLDAPSATLGQLVSTSPTTFSCTLDGFTFSNFQMIITSPTDVGDNIFIDISSVGTNSIVFGTDLIVGQDVEFEYKITPGITQMTLSDGGSGNGTITEDICNAAVFTVNGGNGSNCGTSASNTLGTLSASSGQTVTASVTANSTDWVFKDIDAGNNSGSAVSEFTQTVAPEPMSLSLMGAGLLGIGLLGRKRLRNK